MQLRFLLHPNSTPLGSMIACIIHIVSPKQRKNTPLQPLTPHPPFKIIICILIFSPQGFKSSNHHRSTQGPILQVVKKNVLLDLTGM